METKRRAERYVQFRSALSPDDPKARFPGFCQRTTIFKTKQRVQKGARPLPVDIVMHESMPMVLSDGTKLYYDIFLPAGFQDLETAREDDRKVPALVAWYAISPNSPCTMILRNF